MNGDLADLKRVDKADVYQNRILAGRLERRGDGYIQFTYTDKFLQSGMPGIATSLPSSATPLIAPGGGVPAFFSGLLPEGHRLTVLRNATKTSLADEMTLLMAVGSDTPGNVRIVPSGTKPVMPAAVARIDDPAALDFTLLARNLDLHSIPGVQEKISATMLTTPLAMGEGAYLLKLDPRDHPHLVANEALHLQAAKSLKLPVAKNKVVHDGQNVPGLLVERFDRKYVPGDAEVRRYALEDGLQVLDLPPAVKYSVSAEQVADGLAGYCRAPVIAKRNLYLQFLFAWLTGNGDLHGKNLSILADSAGKFAMAPMYDVPCTLIYGDDTMALSLSGKTKNLKSKHWLEFGRYLGLTERAVLSANQLALKASSLARLDALPIEGSPLRGAVRELRFRRLEVA
ncbi:type II toxin-antitoxin system HipA family toxin [Glutamicibacter sp.]|uniref:type II toxin-antitoxin system HipA family toxin n=1 Tax=Glutamicibacter sp. TaxID=1931995 RepID=UPI002B4A9F2D|nr:HipA domain-containing protein [Glutamicibacter sp.]HJX80237.1 HipA domain-containing protein [Glutamicibacter sp.]